MVKLEHQRIADMWINWKIKKIEGNPTTGILFVIFPDDYLEVKKTYEEEPETVFDLISIIDAYEGNVKNTEEENVFLQKYIMDQSRPKRSKK